MILGLSFATFTLVRVIISLVGIATGIVVLLGMLRGHMHAGWTAIFLATTLLTTLSGLLFPITAFTPALGTGVLSTIILAIALLAPYVFHLAGAWRPVYASPRSRRSTSMSSSRWCRRSRSRAAPGPGAHAIGAAVPGGAGLRAGAVRHRRLHRTKDVLAGAAGARLAAITRERR